MATSEQPSIRLRVFMRFPFWHVPVWGPCSREIARRSRLTFQDNQIIL